jgi:hypothetical protein
VRGGALGVCDRCSETAGSEVPLLPGKTDVLAPNYSLEFTVVFVGELIRVTEMRISCPTRQLFLSKSIYSRHIGLANPPWRRFIRIAVLRANFEGRIGLANCVVLNDSKREGCCCLWSLRELYTLLIATSALFFQFTRMKIQLKIRHRN